MKRIPVFPAMFRRPAFYAACLAGLLSACNSSSNSQTPLDNGNNGTAGTGLASMNAPTPAVNDTGVTYCGTADGNIDTTCGSGEPAYQDAMVGRDPAATAGALQKTGAGQLGFDFTKLGADGQPLAIQNQSWVYDSAGFDGGAEADGTIWSCVKDNVTGLTWEVKTHLAAPDLHDYSWTYTWYNSANISGNKGTETGGVCFQSGRCDTEKYVQDVNAAGLCGYSDWRLPNQQELLSLALLDNTPAIDTTYFPNTVAGNYWSGSGYAGQQNLARYVSFADGHASYNYRSNYDSVRLVRGPQ